VSGTPKLSWQNETMSRLGQQLSQALDTDQGTERQTAVFQPHSHAPHPVCNRLAMQWRARFAEVKRRRRELVKGGETG
jgi:hypothetical protein